MSKNAENLNLRAKAELKLSAKAKEIKHLTKDEITSLVHELEVHQVELEMQNEELRETQQWLEQTRDQYTDLFDFAPVGYLVLDQKGIIKNINLTACDLLGKPRALVKGQPFSMFFNIEQARTFILNLRKAFETDVFNAFETELKYKNNSSFEASIQGSVTRDQTTSQKVCRISLIDITEIKEVEDLQIQHINLQKEKEKLQQYIFFAPVAFLLIDTAYCVQMINKKGSDILGYHHTHILGKHWFDNFISKIDDEKELSASNDNTISDFLKPHFESYLKCNNNDLKLMAWTNIELKDKNNRIVGTLIAGEDITRRKSLELTKKKYTEGLEEIVEERTIELQKALQKEKLINEMKSAFISMASHEFRTPLTSILSSTILIEKYNDLEEHSKESRHINRIKSSVAQIANILEDFLSLDKLEQNNVNPFKETFEINTLITEVIEEFESLLKKGQTIKFVQNTSAKVNLDKAILRNILHNLISNATKYSDEDVEITSKFSKSILIIEIADKGIGVSENDQEHIFAKFFRGKNVANIQGTGLGLSIVKHYIKLLGGNISFQSVPKIGSTFVLKLPL